MTAARIAARDQMKRLTIPDLGRHLNAVADRFVALWAGDADAAKRSLHKMPMEPKLKQMLCLAVDTVVRRHQRRLDCELNGLRIHRGYR